MPDAGSRQSKTFPYAGGTAPPSALPGISPSRGEIGRRECLRQSPELQEKAPQATLPISPLEGEMSGRTEGGARERGAHW
ncbi:MAG: hypothetical protein E5Y04_18595 [Mesorhizobium sp.]|nr:MAG: hypothetical protein EOS12_08770 [Mesorhizobium sp.]TJV23812.1 MAG: hypothetical protein E5Y04_18595 [Mesorhizobium sp.]